MLTNKVLTQGFEEVSIIVYIQYLQQTTLRRTYFELDFLVRKLANHLVQIVHETNAPYSLNQDLLTCL